MTRTVISGVAVAFALGVSMVAQEQRPAGPGIVTMAGCVERWSAGASGSGTMGSAAANPATAQGAFKLSKVEMKAGAVGEPTAKKDAGSKDVRLMTHEKDIDLSKHVGHKVEVSGGWSNSTDTMGTGVGGT